MWLHETIKRLQSRLSNKISIWMIHIHQLLHNSKRLIGFLGTIRFYFFESIISIGIKSWWGKQTLNIINSSQSSCVWTPQFAFGRKAIVYFSFTQSILAKIEEFAILKKMHSIYRLVQWFPNYFGRGTPKFVTNQRGALNNFQTKIFQNWISDI